MPSVFLRYVLLVLAINLFLLVLLKTRYEIVRLEENKWDELKVGQSVIEANENQVLETDKDALRDERGKEFDVPASVNAVGEKLRKIESTNQGGASRTASTGKFAESKSLTDELLSNERQFPERGTNDKQTPGDALQEMSAGVSVESSRYQMRGEKVYVSRAYRKYGVDREKMNGVAFSLINYRRAHVAASELYMRAMRIVWSSGSRLPRYGVNVIRKMNRIRMQLNRGFVDIKLIRNVLNAKAKTASTSFIKKNIPQRADNSQPETPAMDSRVQDTRASSSETELRLRTLCFNVTNCKTCLTRFRQEVIRLLPRRRRLQLFRLIRINGDAGTAPARYSKLNINGLRRTIHPRNNMVAAVEIYFDLLRSLAVALRQRKIEMAFDVLIKIKNYQKSAGKGGFLKLFDSRRNLIAHYGRIKRFAERSIQRFQTTLHSGRDLDQSQQRRRRCFPRWYWKRIFNRASEPSSTHQEAKPDHAPLPEQAIGRVSRAGYDVKIKHPRASDDVNENQLLEIYVRMYSLLTAANHTLHEQITKQKLKVDRLNATLDNFKLDNVSLKNTFCDPIADIVNTFARLTKRGMKLLSTMMVFDEGGDGVAIRNSSIECADDEESTTRCQAKIEITITEHYVVRFLLVERIKSVFRQVKQRLVSWVDHARDTISSWVSRLSSFLTSHPDIVSEVKRWLFKELVRVVKVLTRSVKINPPGKRANSTPSSLDGLSDVENKTEQDQADPEHNETRTREAREVMTNTDSDLHLNQLKTDVNKQRELSVDDTSRSQSQSSSEERVNGGKQSYLEVEAVAAEKLGIDASKVDTSEGSGRIELMADAGVEKNNEGKVKSKLVENSDLVDVTAPSSRMSLPDDVGKVNDGKTGYVNTKRDEEASSKKISGFGMPFVKHISKGGEAKRTNIYLERLVSLWKSKSSSWSHVIWWLALLPHRTLSFIRRLELANLRLRMVFFSKFMEENLGFVGRKVVPAHHKPDAVTQALGKAKQRNAFKLKPVRSESEGSLDSEPRSQMQRKEEDRRKSMAKISHFPDEDLLLKRTEIDEQINTGDNEARAFLKNNESVYIAHNHLPSEHESGSDEKNEQEFSIKMELVSKDKLPQKRRKRFSGRVSHSGEAMTNLKVRIDALGKLMKNMDDKPKGLSGPENPDQILDEIVTGKSIPKKHEEKKLKEQYRKDDLDEYLRHKTHPHGAGNNAQEAALSPQFFREKLQKIRQPTHEKEKVGGVSPSGLVKTEGVTTINGAATEINSSQNIADALRSRLVELIKLASERAKLKEKHKSDFSEEEGVRLKMNSLQQQLGNGAQKKLDALYDDSNAYEDSDSEMYLKDDEERLLAEARSGQPTEADFNLLENIARLTSKFLGDNGEKIGELNKASGEYESANAKPRYLYDQKQRVKRSETEAEMEARLNVKPEPPSESALPLYLKDDKAREFHEKWQKLKPQATKLESEVKMARAKYAEVSDDLQQIVQKGDELMARAEKVKSDDSGQKSMDGANWDAAKKEFEVFKKEIVAKEDQFIKIKTQVDPDLASETAAKLKEVVYKLKEAADGEFEAGLNLPFSLVSDSDKPESSDSDKPEYLDSDMLESLESDKQESKKNVNNRKESYRTQKETELYDPFLDPVESPADVFKDSEDASIETFDYNTKGKFLDERLTDLDSDPEPYETKAEFLEKNDQQELEGVEKMLTKLRFRAKLSRNKREETRKFTLKKNRRDSDVRPFSSSVSKGRFEGSTAAQFSKEINRKRWRRRVDIKYATLSGSRNVTDRSLQRYENTHSQARSKRRAARPDLTTVKPTRGSADTVEAEVKRREKYADTSKYDFSDYGIEVSYDEMDETKPEDGEVPPSMGDTLSDIDGSYLNDDPGNLFSPGSKAVNEADDAASREFKEVAEMEGDGELEEVGDMKDKNNKNLEVILMKPLGSEGELANFKRPIGYHNELESAMRSVDENLGLGGEDGQTGQPIGDNSDIDTEIGDIVNESEGGTTREEADEGLKVFDQILRDNMDDYSDLKISGDVDLDKKAVGQQRVAMENARIKGIDAEVMRQRLNIMEETMAERLRERLEHEKELKEIDNIDEMQREISESLEEMSSMMNIKNKSKNATTSRVSTQIPQTFNQSNLGLNTTRSSGGQNETTGNEEYRTMSSTDTPEHGDVDIYSSVSYNNIKGNQSTTYSQKKVSKPATTSPKLVERGGTTKGVAIGQKGGKQWRTRESYYDRKRDRTTEGEASDRREDRQWRTGESYNERKHGINFDEDETESPPRANWNYENKLYSKLIKSDTPEQYREESLIVEEHKPVAQREHEKRVSNATARKQHSTKRHRSRKRRSADAQKETNDARVADRNELSEEPGSSYSLGEGMSELSPKLGYDPEHDVIWEDNDDDDLMLENSQIWLEETDRKAAEEEKRRKNSSQNEMLEKNIFPFADPVAVNDFYEELERGYPLESGDDLRQDGTKRKLFNIEQKDVSSEHALEIKSNQIEFQPPTNEKPLTDEQLLAEFQVTKNSQLPTNNQSPQSYQRLSNKQLLTNKHFLSNDQRLTNAQPGAEELGKQNTDAKNNNPLSMYSNALHANGMTSINNQRTLVSEKRQSNTVIKDIPISANQDVVTAENSFSANLKPRVITKLTEPDTKRNENSGSVVMDPAIIKHQTNKVKFEAPSIADYQDGNSASIDVEAPSALAASKSNQPLATAELSESEAEKLEGLFKSLSESSRPLATSENGALEKVLGKSRSSHLPAIPQNDGDEIPITAQNTQSAFMGRIDEQKSYENSNRLFSSLLELEEKIENPPPSELAEADLLGDTDGVMQLEPFEYLPVKSGTRDGGETVEGKKDDELADVTVKDETSEFYKKWNQIENIELRRLESNVASQRYEALDDLRKEKLRMKLSQDEDVENEEGNDGLTAAVSDLDDEKFEKSFQDLSLFAEIPVRKKGSAHLLGKTRKPKGSNIEQWKEKNEKKSSYR